MFVVLGHNPLTTACPKLFNIIFSFHIPLFFFISGYLFNSDTSFGYRCKRRFDSLIRPYVFTVGVVCLAYILLKRSPSPFWYMFWALYGNGPNLPKLVLHLWFLPNLFLVSLFAWLLLRYVILLKRSIVFQVLTVIIFFILGLLEIDFFWNIKTPSSVANLFVGDFNNFLINGLLDNPAYLQERLAGEKQFILKGLPWSADIMLLTGSFFVSGYFVRKNHLEFVFHKHSVALLMVAFFAVLHFFFNCTIDLSLRRYDNIIFSTLLAFAGIYICTYAANNIMSFNNYFTKILKYIGIYSLVIYIFHPILQRIVYSGMLAFFPDATYITFPAVFAAGVGLPLLLNFLLLERFKFFRYWYYAK